MKVQRAKAESDGVYSTVAEPDLPRETRTQDVEAWRARNDAKRTGPREAALRAERVALDRKTRQGVPVDDVVLSDGRRATADPPAATERPASAAQQRAAARAAERAQQVARWAAAYRAGDTLTVIANREGLSPQSIHRALRLASVQMRSRGDRGNRPAPVPAKPAAVTPEPPSVAAEPAPVAPDAEPVTPVQSDAERAAALLAALDRAPVNPAPVRTAAALADATAALADALEGFVDGARQLLEAQARLVEVRVAEVRDIADRLREVQVQ